MPCSRGNEASAKLLGNVRPNFYWSSRWIHTVRRSCTGLSTSLIFENQVRRYYRFDRILIHFFKILCLAPSVGSWNKNTKKMTAKCFVLNLNLRLCFFLLSQNEMKSWVPPNGFSSPRNDVEMEYEMRDKKSAKFGVRSYFDLHLNTSHDKI